MSRRAPVVELTVEEQEQLEAIQRRHGAGQLQVVRARVLLLAGEGCENLQIAQELKIRPATVGKIRTRFGRLRLGALEDAPRPGRKPSYGPQTERRVLTGPGRAAAPWLRSLERPVTGRTSRRCQRRSGLAGLTPSRHQSGTSALLVCLHRCPVRAKSRRCGGPLPRSAPPRHRALRG